MADADEAQANTKLVSPDMSTVEVFVPLSSIIASLRTHFGGTAGERFTWVSYYGLSWFLESTLSEIFTVTDHCQHTLFVHPGESGEEFPTARDPYYQDFTSRYETIINDTIRRLWDVFDHSTSNIVAYVSQALSQDTANATLTQCMKLLKDMRMLPTDELVHAVERILEFEECSGDCSAAHYKLKKRLNQIPTLGEVRWCINTGGQHAILSGSYVDGSLFVTDFGINRQCMRFSPYERSCLRMPLLRGKFGDIRSDSDNHLWKAERNQKGLWSILYKVFPLNHSH